MSDLAGWTAPSLPFPTSATADGWGPVRERQGSAEAFCSTGTVQGEDAAALGAEIIARLASPDAQRASAEWRALNALYEHNKKNYGMHTDCGPCVECELRAAVERARQR